MNVLTDSFGNAQVAHASNGNEHDGASGVGAQDDTPRVDVIAMVNHLTSQVWHLSGYMLATG
jgi:hypothetical protein